MLTWDDLAFTVLAEIASFYPSRGSSGRPEVLINAGCIALGREPCKAYDGWGIVSPWNRADVSMPVKGPEEYKGWVVNRVSQEHGVLGWMGEWDDSKSTGGNEGDDPEQGMKIGERIRIWPNHAKST